MIDADPHATPRSPSGLVVGAVILMLLACALVFGVIFLFSARLSPEQQTAAIHDRHPAFNLEQEPPKADAQALAVTQEALLQGYGWIDQTAGIARIPIEQAMALIVTEQAEATETPP